MIKKVIRENGLYQKLNKGGVLLTALFFMLFFSGILLIILDDYHISQQFYLASKELYQAKIMKEIFLDEYYNSNEMPNNPTLFNCGRLSYTEKEQLIISVTISQRVFTFYEALK